MGTVINVTERLNLALTSFADIQSSLRWIRDNPLFGRETRSAALGEISEHVVARLLDGVRRPNGHRGHDVRAADGTDVEVKSRLLTRWGDDAQFNFGLHTASANWVYCVGWEQRDDCDSIQEAYLIPLPTLMAIWGTPNQAKYSARTTLGKIRAASLT